MPYLADLKKSHLAERVDLKKSLRAFEGKLADAERRIQEFEHRKDTLDSLATKVHEAEAKLKIFR